MTDYAFTPMDGASEANARLLTVSDGNPPRDWARDPQRCITIRNLMLVDADVRRRAAVSRQLLAESIHVEPFESVAELMASRPESGAILVRDEAGAVGDVARAMAESGECLPIVAFREDPAPSDVVQATLDGANEYVAWPVRRAGLAAAVARATDRSANCQSPSLRQAAARARIERLTGREREVLEGVACGLSNRLIAANLSISPRTVEVHRANMLQKLGVANTSGAIRIAIEGGLGT